MCIRDRLITKTVLKNERCISVTQETLHISAFYCTHYKYIYYLKKFGLDSIKKWKRNKVPLHVCTIIFTNDYYQNWLFVEIIYKYSNYSSIYNYNIISVIGLLYEILFFYYAECKEIVLARNSHCLSQRFSTHRARPTDGCRGGVWWFMKSGSKMYLSLIHI